MIRFYWRAYIGYETGRIEEEEECCPRHIVKAYIDVVHYVVIVNCQLKRLENQPQEQEATRWRQLGAPLCSPSKLYMIANEGEVIPTTGWRSTIVG